MFDKLISLIEDYESSKSKVDLMISGSSSAIIEILNADTIRVKSAEENYITDAIVDSRYYETIVTSDTVLNLIAAKDYWNSYKNALISLCDLPKTNADLSTDSTIENSTICKIDAIKDINKNIIATANNKYPEINNVEIIGGNIIIVFRIVLKIISSES